MRKDLGLKVKIAVGRDKKQTNKQTRNVRPGLKLTRKNARPSE